MQLEKNQKILPSTQGEAVFHCAFLREISPALLSLERVLDMLDATQKVLQHTHLHSRGIPRVLTQLKKSPVFLPHFEMRIHFPASSGREFWPSHHTARGDGLNLKVERNTRGGSTIPKDPNCRDPAREIPPMTNSCGETKTGQGESGLKGYSA